MKQIAEQIVDAMLEMADDPKQEYARGQKWGVRDRETGTERELDKYPDMFVKGYRMAQGLGLRGRLSSAWNSFKAVTGIGHDEFGMGKNTEPGWKPKYGPTGTTFISKPKPKARAPETGPKTWEIS